MARLLFLLPIGILAVSTASIFVKLCDAPALIIAAYRMVLASFLLLPLAAHQKVWRQWNILSLKWSILPGLFLGFHFTFWIGSLKFTTVASSVVLVSTSPLFVGIGGWLFLGERLNPQLMLGIILSVIGSGLISYGDMTASKDAFLGDGMALLGALGASGYFLVGRKLRKDQGLVAYILPVYSTAAAVLILLSLSFQKPFFGYSSATYALFLLLALIPQLIGHTTLNWALKYLPASLVAITTLGEPVGSSILAYIVLGESLTALKILGGLTIFAGILIALSRNMSSAGGK
jgi:drug/metabolite transporter (DMT)-like permease